MNDMVSLNPSALNRFSATCDGLYEDLDAARQTLAAEAKLDVEHFGGAGAPWASQLARQWSDSLDARLTDAATARDELSRIADAIDSIVRGFTGTDADNSVNINSVLSKD